MSRDQFRQRTQGGVTLYRDHQLGDGKLGVYAKGLQGDDGKGNEVAEISGEMTCICSLWFVYAL